MSTSYSHFTITERENLLVFRERGMSIREMARRLGRSPSSVSRELKRNAGRGGHYSPSQAQQRYQMRRRNCVRNRRLDNPDLKEFVTQKLMDFWSPEQISGRQKVTRSKMCVSYTTIYRGIHSGILDVPKRVLRRKGHKPSPHKDETRGRLHGHKTIHERPKGADNRSRFGHWEGDTVLGGRGKGVACTFVDRRSGYLIAARMPNRKADTLNKYWCQAFEHIPAKLRLSFTVDHGNEFFSYKQIEQVLKTKVFFADPYSPWQRGSNENTNGLLRQYFPKKCDFLSVTDDAFQVVIDSINNRPRKRLGFRSPAECFPLRSLNFSCCT